MLDEDDDGVDLAAVQALHRAGAALKHAVMVLERHKEKPMTKKQCSKILFFSK